MINFRAIVVLISILFFGLFEASAQDSLKQEIEKRIRQQDMPEPALDFLKNWLKHSRRIRYYYQTDGEDISYEAKLIREGRRFSIEFNEAGTLLDIEELISYDRLPQSTKLRIDSVLVSSYQKHKIRRLQRQFLPSSEKEYEKLKAFSFSKNGERYELEIDTQNNSSVQSYEILFNALGQPIQRRLIVRRSLDNLIY